MADNIAAKSDAATTVATLAADDIASVYYPRSKITLGADGVNDGDVSSSNPMPVGDAGGSLTVDNAALSVTGGGVEATALRVTIASDSTGVVSVDDNGASLTVDNAALSVTGGGLEATALRVTIASDSTGVLSIDDNGGAITVDNGGTFAVQAAQSGTWNITDVSGTVSLPTGAATLAEQQTQTTALQLIDDAVYTDGTGTPSKGIAVMGTDGTNPQLISVDASGNVQVDLVTANVTNAGTFAVQVDGTALTRLTDIETNTDSCAVVGNGAAATAQRVTLANDSTGVIATLTTLTGGGVAHDSADSGNPHKIGAKAETALSGVTLVADGDRTDLHAGVDGVLITRPHCNLEDIVSGNASNTDGTSTQCIAAQAAGVKTYLTSIILTNTSSSNTYVEIKDGTTAKLTIPVPANGGAVCNLPVPLGGTAATAWNFDPGAATTTMYCSMVGFKSKV